MNSNKIDNTKYKYFLKFRARRRPPVSFFLFSLRNRKKRKNSKCLELQEKCSISESDSQNNVSKGSDCQCVGGIFFRSHMKKNSSMCTVLKHSSSTLQGFLECPSCQGLIQIYFAFFPPVSCTPRSGSRHSYFLQQSIYLNTSITLLLLFHLPEMYFPPSPWASFSI